MDRKELMKALITFGAYSYTPERIADITNTSLRQLKKLLKEDAELRECYTNAIDSVKRMAFNALLEAIQDKKVEVRKPIKLKEGRNERIVYGNEELYYRGDVAAIKFLLTNLNSDMFALDGKANANNIGDVVINITPVATPTLPTVEENGMDDA